jgi:hypothetical protein
MATKYSDLFPSKASPVVGLAQRKEGFRTTPRVSITTIEYTFDGTEVAGDVIRLWLAPQGTIILPHLSGIQVQVDAAATLTIDVGDEDTTGVGAAADPDRYSDGVDAGAVGWKPFAGGVAAGVFYRINGQVGQAGAYVDATLVTLATPAVGGKLVFSIAYLGA